MCPYFDKHREKCKTFDGKPEQGWLAMQAMFKAGGMLDSWCKGTGWKECGVYKGEQENQGN